MLIYFILSKNNVTKKVLQCQHVIICFTELVRKRWYQELTHSGLLLVINLLNITDRYLDHMCAKNKLKKKHSNLPFHALKVQYFNSHNIYMLLFIRKNLNRKVKTILHCLGSTTKSIKQ